MNLIFLVNENSRVSGPSRENCKKQQLFMNFVKESNFNDGTKCRKFVVSNVFVLSSIVKMTRKNKKLKNIKDKNPLNILPR